MIDHEIWRTEPAGALSAESCDFRLIVQAPQELRGEVRFLVLRRGGVGVPDRLLDSGTQQDVRAAMQAAERVADRWTKLDLLENAVQP